MSQKSSTSPAPGVANRRDFLRRAGFGVVVSASVLQACDTTDPPVESDEGFLRGVVTNPDGEPVEGATVSVDGTSFTTQTDEQGRYRFDDIPEGTYTVTLAPFSQTGASFEGQQAQVNIFLGGTGYTQNFNLGEGLPVVTFDFSNDFGILNYAYALEQLEAAFYAAVVGGAGFGDLFSADEQAVMQSLAAHEAIHRDFLATAIPALGGTLIPGLSPDFDDIDFGDRGSILTTAQTFEDLGVGAYNGAGQYIQDGRLLTIAGKIVSVEARHASIISGIIRTDDGHFDISGEGVIDEDGLDQALSPSTVLEAADPFIFNTVSVSNVPVAS